MPSCPAQSAPHHRAPRALRKTVYEALSIPGSRWREDRLHYGLRRSCPTSSTGRGGGQVVHRADCWYVTEAGQGPRWIGPFETVEAA